ncbi:molybdopterin cofactor-binding domain-containing protein [Nocardioides sp. B-3]|uniref:molybdopterin cofactor-binding domain-containing protein n=1 Tax=Nocardioides sp. B-3 TaxID=2895565 RepID=UPI00300E3A2E
MHVYKDGSVLINHGGTEMGRGLHTKMLQVAATSLGVPLERVRLAPTRTDKVPNTSATAASSGADLNGAAIKNACEQIRARLSQVDGAGLTREELVPKAYFQRIQLWAAGFYKTEGLHWDAAAMRGTPFKYFAYGVAAAEVEVDGFDGSYTLRRVDIVHDVGDSLSPLIDVGQIEGGFVQGRRLADSGRPPLGRIGRTEPGPARDPGGQHLQAAELLRDARGLQRDPVGEGARGRRGLRLQGCR